MKYQPFCLAILFRGVYAAATHPAAAPTTHNNIPTVVSTTPDAAYHPTEISNIGDLIPSSTAVIMPPSISRRNLNSDLTTCPTPLDSSRCSNGGLCSTDVGSPCYNAKGTVGNGSCNDANACVGKTATVENNACNGNKACYESGDHTKTIYDFGCNGPNACSGSEGNIGAINGDPSCQGTSACEDSKANIDENSCFCSNRVRYKCSQGNYSCYQTAGTDGIGTIGKGSCIGPYACCGYVGDVDDGDCNAVPDGTGKWYSKCCNPFNPDCENGCGLVPSAMPSKTLSPSLSSVPSQIPSESLQPSSNPSETPSLSIVPTTSLKPSISSRPSASSGSPSTIPSISSAPSETCVDICDGYNPFTFDPPPKSTRSGPTNSPTKWSKPTWNTPTRKPTWSKPTNKPVWSKPTDKPVWSKPTPEPTKSSSPSESSKPTWNKPTWSKLTDKPPKKKPRRELDAHFNSYWPGDYEFWTATNSENGGVAMNWQVNRAVDSSTSSGYDYFLQSPAYNGATTERNAQAILQICSNFEGGTMRVSYTANVQWYRNNEAKCGEGVEECGQLFQVYVCPTRGDCDVNTNLVTGGNITAPVTTPTILPIALGPGPHYVHFKYTWFPQKELPDLDSGVVKIYEVDLPCGHNFPTFSPTTVPSLAPSVSPTSVPSTNPTSSPSGSPSRSPSDPPTGDPTTSPTLSPTISPTLSPTLDPTTSPTLGPTMSPINPTLSPSYSPTKTPTLAPSFSPTTPEPTLEPTLEPTNHPTVENPIGRLPTTAKPTGGGWSPPHDKPNGSWSPPHDKPNGGWNPPHDKPNGSWSPPNSNPTDDGWNSQSPIAWKNDGWGGKSDKANTKASKAKTLKSRVGPKRWIPASGGDWLSYGGWETADWGSDSDSDDFSWSGKWAGRYDSSSWSDKFKWDRPMRGKSSKSKSSKKADSWNSMSMSYSNGWWNDGSSKFVWDTQSKSSKDDGMSMAQNNDWWNVGSSSSIPGGLWIDPAYSGSSSSQSHQSSQQSVGENMNKPTSNDSQNGHHVGQSGKDDTHSYNPSESTQSTKSSKVGQIERSPPHSNGSSEEISIEDYNKMKYWAEKKWQNKKQSSKSAGVRVGLSSMSRMMLLTSTVAMPLLLGFFAFL